MRRPHYYFIEAPRCPWTLELAELAAVLCSPGARRSPEHRSPCDLGDQGSGCLAVCVIGLSGSVEVRGHGTAARPWHRPALSPRHRCAGGAGLGPYLISQMQMLTSGRLRPGPSWVGLLLVWPGLACAVAASGGWAVGWVGGWLVWSLCWAGHSLLPQGRGLVTWRLNLEGNQKAKAWNHKHFLTFAAVSLAKTNHGTGLRFQTPRAVETEPPASAGQMAL